MVKIVKFFALFAFFILALIYFVPKQSLYYGAEKELQKQKVIFSQEEIVQNAFSLELNHLDISYAAIDSAKIANANIKLFVLYNSLSVKDINLSSVASAFIPLHIEKLSVKYSILNPLNIVFNAQGAFGEAQGNLYIPDKNVSFILQPSLLMLQQYKSTMREFTKNSKGEYSYAKSF